MFKSFQDLGVSEAVVDALEKVGVVAPFPVQALVMRDAMSGADVLAKSETGSGKTLAFAIPIVERLDPSASKRPMALVLVPTRELAVQVRDDFAPIAKAKGLKMAVAYGGTGVREQAKGLSEAHIVVATPGRLQDYAERGDIKLGAVETFVLDEADRMLDMGFLPQVDRIVRRLPKDRQTMFFSATLDGDVGRIASVFTRNAIRHEVVSDSKTAEMIDHRFVPVDPHDRVDKLIELLHEEERELALVFVRTKRGADRLVKQLKAKDVNASAMHGDMTQQARERALKRFEEGKVDVLIATDVAARGLDLYAITHVINYDPPEDDKGYVHRVGRTARAGRSGISITLVSAEQQGDVSRMAARLDLSDEFQEEGMKVAPPRMVFSGSRGGRRSGLRKPTRRR
ncbi:MAG: DEAD/DEAH box helicase [Actinomycetota bacterium]|jgi:ATP-dependent RNA helicase RhlE|nr:DEAD/DEAH box helicase [Actinomycetota bacterium]